MGKELLNTKNLSIGYQGSASNKVLARNLNLSLSSGDFVALLGPNGSGKSTLIRSISGLLNALEGFVFIDGKELKTLSKSQRARMISLVLTDPITTTALSVSDVVAYGRFPYTNWLGKLSDEDHEIIDKSLELVDMLSFRSRQLNTLSDGERQRVMIAKALAQRSAIMILDEPTAHLDLINRVEIMKLLRTIAHTQNQAILISTHELDLATQSADTLWLMGENQSISVGAPEDLILNNALQKVFAQSSVDFDHLTGLFKIKHDTHKEIHFQCNDAQIALWTRKALEKIGISISSDSKLDYILEYDIVQKVWVYKVSDKEISFSTLADLVSYLKKND